LEGISVTKQKEIITMTSFIFDAEKIPAQLSKRSLLGDVLVAYEFCTRDDVDKALDTQKDETAALTDADLAAGMRARFISQILLGQGSVSQDQLDYGMSVQKHLRQKARK
jgi:hypothetical protein